MLQTPLWEIFFSTLGGTLVGFFLALFATAVRERPSLTVRIQGPKELVYVTENKPESGSWSYTVVTPDQATEAVLTIQMVITNASAAHDAITDASLVFQKAEDRSGATRVPARNRADSGFEGINIPPRQTVSQRVRFFLPKSGTASRDNVRMEVPEGVWQVDRPFPDMALEWTSVRKRVVSRASVNDVIPIRGPWMILHSPGIDIGYLHSKS